MPQPAEPVLLIRRRLRALGRRLRLSDTLLFASRSLWVSTLLFALIMVAGHLMPIPLLHTWALLPLLLWVVVVLGYLLLRPLPLLRVAQRVDSSLGLRERLATALELHARSAHPSAHQGDTPAEPASAELVSLQQDDAASTVRELKAGALPLHLDRRVLMVGMLPLALGLALMWLPNPQNGVLAEQQAVEAAIDEVIDELETAQDELAANDALSPDERAELDRQLEDLQERLRENASNREDALAELSSAEARLQQELDPQADAQRAALERMARNLESASGRQPSQNPDLDQAAQDLEDLAEMLDSMSEEELDELAEQLAEQAAQAASGDQQTAQDMADAAEALREGDLADAAESLQQAADDVRDAQSDLADQDATSRTLSDIQDARDDIARAGEQSEGQQGQQGQQGEGQQGQQGQGQQGQQGQGEGQQGQGEGQQGQQGEGQQGQGEGQQGQGEGQQGQGEGQQGQGGSNAQNLGQGQRSTPGNPDGDGAPGGGQGDGEGDTVYQPFESSGERGERDVVRGQQGEGGQVEQRQGNSNVPGVNNPSVVPYEEAFPDYAEAASEALDRGYIPPHLKDYVRDYFSQLEPGTGGE